MRKRLMKQEEQGVRPWLLWLSVKSVHPLPWEIFCFLFFEMESQTPRSKQFLCFSLKQVHAMVPSLSMEDPGTSDHLTPTHPSA